jgi:DNA gyrase subunit A
MQEHIQNVALHETARERYLNYALSVITARALPDVRDGLKPVQRRILYAMHQQLHLTADAKHKKSAAVVGEVMAKLHPHGDQAIYDAMARMAQDFTLRYPLIDGQGNFGSLDGDEPAAMRYTEARLRHLADELLEEIRRDTVEWRPNYDGTLREPVVLPAQVPLLLINGSSGIAVGMATSVPPHNLGEVLQALEALIDEPDLPVEALTRHVQGPDFPTGGALLTPPSELLEIYRTGQGSLTLRGEYRLERDGARTQIVVHSVPYGLNKATLVAEIAEHIAQERVPQLLDVRDESTDEVRVVLELRRGADPEAAMAYLFKRTALETRIPVNLTALCPTPHGDVCEPRRLSLREMLVEFLRFRLEVTRRRLAHELGELERRIHLLEGFARLFDGLDVALTLIRQSRGKAEAAAALMARFDLDEEQVEAILETRLYRLAQLEIRTLLDELGEKQAQARGLRQTLASEVAIWALIKRELAEIREAYSDARRTQVTGPPLPKTFSVEAYIVDEDAVVMVTRDGWFKRQKSYTGLSAVRVREGDSLGWVLPASTRASLVLFTSKGKAYTLRVADVPQTTGHGEPLPARFDFGDGERVVGAVVTDPRSLPVCEATPPESLEPGAPRPPFVVAVTRAGRCLRLSLEAYTEPSTVAGRLYLRTEPEFLNDAVVSVLVSDGRETVALATRRARVLLFPVDEINVLSGPGKGVLAVKLDEHDWVMGFCLSREATEGLEVETNRGRVEAISPARYQVTHRGNRGRELIKVGHLSRVGQPAVEVVWSRPTPPEDPRADEPPGQVTGAGEPVSSASGSAALPSPTEPAPSGAPTAVPQGPSESGAASASDPGAPSKRQGVLFDE